MVKKSVFGVIILSVAFIAGCNNEDSSRSHITESKAEQLLSLLNENPSKEGLEKLKSLVVPLNEGIKNNEEIAIVLPIDISSDTLTEIECL
ncbi:MAG: hypothetical protein LBG59_07355 [Candidatus Peribacteria bacterium]|jgi:hypothetical protein|nr:hypothetical protein [Candidatus Peribacteria bacterium]